MTRLGSDVRGNVIAISAAALIPLAGLIGGGVDMSRLYLTKTRLQQACDAGVLAGRRAMGSGSWTEEGSTSTRSRALELFNANFTDGAYGTTLLDHDFSEDDGEVTGFADVSVPMTIMRIFGITERTMHVTCTAKMEIPNTDVMFVLDVTGSMAGTRIAGLKSAVKCFYEALLRVNTAEVCGNDPTGTSYSGTAQIRIGFVPYAVNVNVGKLLHNDWLVDSWTYQSREGVNNKIYSWVLGNVTNASYGAWRPVSPGTTLTTTNGYNTFNIVPNDNYILADGIKYFKNATTAKNTSQCDAMNTYGGGSQILGVINSATGTPQTTYIPTDNDPPVYPASSQAQSARQTQSATASNGFRYRWFKNGSTTACWLEMATKRTGGGHTASYTQERMGTAEMPITWTERNQVTWTYKPVTMNVSALKAGGWNWNNSLTLPLGESSVYVRPSGESNPRNVTAVVNRTVSWGGCIEERKTVKNSDADPSDEWMPIPTDAYDLDIDMVPSSWDPETQWAPMLQNTVFGRTFNGARTLDPSSTPESVGYSCPTAEAKKLQTWYTPNDFVSYVNALPASGNTYHDIGMIWGARLLSPTGLFASENAETPTGGAIQRHLIFMTDGDTEPGSSNYTYHGVAWWDRRQTTYEPSVSDVANVVNSRLEALCTAVKNRNITLWVVSYGTSTSGSTNTRLSNCASPGKFFRATNSATLISNFKQIASEIADLRLTN